MIDGCWRRTDPDRRSGASRTVAAQLVLDRVDERLPRGLDDVVGNTDGAPGLVAIARGDEHARLGGRALRLVQDSHFVVEELHGPEARIELLQSLTKRVVEGVDRTVPRRGGVLQHPLHPHAHRGLRYGLL